MTDALLFEDEAALSKFDGNNLINGKSDGSNVTDSYRSSKEDEYPISGIKFEVASARTIEVPKKYVVYTIVVRKDGPEPDGRPCAVERRYSEFLELYTALRQEFPTIFSSLSFPKKAVIGNFSSEIISFRSAGFESLLLLLANSEKIRESVAVVDFLQKKELKEALQLIQDGSYNKAVVLLEHMTRLLNKLYTNRHVLVLRALCLLVACCDAAQDFQTQRFALTAVQRFEGVSDTDLLRYYVPLLQLSVKWLQQSGPAEDLQLLQDRLVSMKRRGVRVDGCLSLLDSVLADFTTPS